MVKGKLQQAFAMSKSQPYQLFTCRVLRVDESLDAYVTDLQRLLELSGHQSADADKDPVIVEELLKGLPVDFARQLRLTSAGAELSVSQCVDKVRAL